MGDFLAGSKSRHIRRRLSHSMRNDITKSLHLVTSPETYQNILFFQFFYLQNLPPFSSPAVAWPGGMRVAVEYGQPSAGLSRVGSSRQIHPTAESVSASAKRSIRPPRVPPGLTPAWSFQTSFFSSFSFAFHCIFKYRPDFR